MGFIVGTKVRAKVSFPAINVNEGELGYVYEVYNFGTHYGVSVIFERGGYDGYSEQEQNDFLEFVDVNENYTDYKFTTVIRMYADWMFGFWRFHD